KAALSSSAAPEEKSGGWPLASFASDKLSTNGVRGNTYIFDRRAGAIPVRDELGATGRGAIPDVATSPGCGGDVPLPARDPALAGARTGRRRVRPARSCGAWPAASPRRTA